MAKRNEPYRYCIVYHTRMKHSLLFERTVKDDVIISVWPVLSLVDAIDPWG
jgi:hypothetical protein